MRRVALSLIMFLAALLSACEIPRTDLSGIKFGATRATVEGVLGKPVKSMQTDTWRIDTYKYNKGYTPIRGGGADREVYPSPLILPALMFAAVVGPIVHSNNYADQRGDIGVAYGPDDRVVRIGLAPGDNEVARKEWEKHLVAAEKGDREAQFRLASLSSFVDERRKWLSLAANQGHAEAQFRLVSLSSSADERRKWLNLAANQGHAGAQFQRYTRDKPDEKSLTWLCLAANQSHALAQEELGDLHVKDLGQAWREAGLVKLDRVRAYMWYSLAAVNGDDLWAGYTRDDLAYQMTPAQIAEAEQLVTEWKPGDCGAEGSPTKSTG